MVRKDDDDLQDLLGGNSKSNSSKGAPPSQQRQRFEGPMQLSIVDFCSQYTSMLCYYYPVMCGAFSTLVVFGLFLFCLTFLVNTKKEFGLAHDHSNIKSRFDLKVGAIDHWCLGGGNDNCPCEDPLQPLARIERSSWVQAVKANRKLVKELVDQPVDVAFLGESVIEEMGGRWMGSRTIAPLKHVFDSFFSGERGVKGVALGVAGDTAPNVLWRLIHGELREDFNPAVWWVSLGNNDLGRMLCSEEVVEMGILRVVEELLEKKPKAHIVINSVFPMTDMRGGLYPVLNDYRDSFVSVGKKSLEPDADVNEDPGRRRLLRFGSNTEANGEPPIGEGGPDDEVLAQKAFVEEEVRDKKAHIERYYQQHMRQDPVMRDTPFARNFRTGTFRAAKMPIWTSIKAINEGLKKFADSHPRVTFFDCTPIFVEVNEERNRSILMTKYISMRGHLTKQGFERWEQRVKETVEAILDENGLRTTKGTERGADDELTDDSLLMPYDDAFNHFGDGASIVGQGWKSPPLGPIEEDALPGSDVAQTEQQHPWGDNGAPAQGLLPLNPTGLDSVPDTVTPPESQFGSVEAPGHPGIGTMPGSPTVTTEEQSSSGFLPSETQNEIGNTSLPATQNLSVLGTEQTFKTSSMQEQPNDSTMTESLSSPNSFRPQLAFGGVTVSRQSNSTTEPTAAGPTFATNPFGESSGTIKGTNATIASRSAEVTNEYSTPITNAGFDAGEDFSSREGGGAE